MSTANTPRLSGRQGVGGAVERRSAGINKACRNATVKILDTLGLKTPIKKVVRATRNLGIPKSEPHILRELPHDPSAFTQGLHIHDGVLYESTGLVGQSSLRVIDRQTGAILKKITVEGQFAEGIAVLDDRLVQLLWYSQQALVYRLPDLMPLEPYRYSGEGWGMTATQKYFLTSHGTGEIVYRGRDFKEIKSLKVSINGFPLKGINDLAWANGSIYCNVLRDNNLYEVDENHGKVVNIFDCSRIVEMAAPPGDANVLNGIAYDEQTDTFIVTGKRWQKYFQVKLGNRP